MRLADTPWRVVERMTVQPAHPLITSAAVSFRVEMWMLSLTEDACVPWIDHRIQRRTPMATTGDRW